MADVTTSVKTKNYRWAFGAFGGSAGLLLGLAALEALRARPELVPQLLSGGFLGFAALVLGMVMFRKQFDSFNATQERHAVSSEQLAANVGALVMKDDQRTREQDLTLNHLARQTDAIHDELMRQKKERETP